MNKIKILEYPGEKYIVEIVQNMESLYPDIFYKENDFKFNEHEVTSIEELFEILNAKTVDYWKSQYNLKLNNMFVNYSYMNFYYNLGLEGKRIEELEGDLLSVYHWFSYHIESLVSRLIGLFENMYHIVNEKYELYVKQNISFKHNIKKKLESKYPNSKMEEFLVLLFKNNALDKLKSIRNDYIHNGTPSFPDSGVSKENGFTAFGNGKYISGDDLVKIIDEAIKYLEKSLIKFNQIIKEDF